MITVPADLQHRSAADAAELLSVTARPMDGRGRVVVEVVGEVDGETVALLQACLDGQTRRPALRRLVVDLTGATSLGAVAPGVLARAGARCRSRGARLVVRSGQ